jgi:hypothetical protein
MDSTWLTTASAQSAVDLFPFCSFAPLVFTIHLSPVTHHFRVVPSSAFIGRWALGVGRLHRISLPKPCYLLFVIGYLFLISVADSASITINY